MKNRNIIIISSIDWTTHWQIHQQIASYFVDHNNRVLFIENTGTRSVKPRDIGRIKERIKNWYNSIHGYKEVKSNLFIFSPLIIPLPYSRIVNLINSFLLNSSLAKWIKAARFENPIVITFLPTPLSHKIIQNIDPDLAVYYCADNMGSTTAINKKLKYWENLLFNKVDLVLTTSETIQEKANKHSEKVYLFPCGVDLLKFSISKKYPIPTELVNVSKPIIGYIGALSDVLDQELIIKIAQKIPQATIVMVGPTYTNVTKLKKIKNILLTGIRNHDLIPAYINSFDVTLIPYVKSEFTESVYSCKLNEYLAMGKPIVSTNIKEIRNYSEKYYGTVEIANNHEQFVNKVINLINNSELNSEELIRPRVNAAKENSWDKRFEGILNTISHELENQKGNKNYWKARVYKYFKWTNNFFIKSFSIFVIFYLLIFKTPLFWFAGDMLVSREVPIISNAIVVFSGDGESTYRNQSYQNRALDAVEYFKKGFGKKIYISSGKEQTISEVEIIKLYLLDKGVPDSSIEIIKKYPNSTFQNVQIVSKILKRDKIESIIFLTAPYHSLRANLIWKKMTPEIKVTSPPVNDTPANKPLWNASISQIKSIGYEYLAIIYNWYLGRL